MFVAKNVFLKNNCWWDSCYVDGYWSVPDREIDRRTFELKTQKFV